MHREITFHQQIMFSVLLSVYKKEHPTYLKQSLDSLFAQTLTPDEIVLVKDGPLTPELEAVVTEYQSRYPMLKVVPLPQNQGLGKALNEGLKHCSYELVARMDTDDIAKPERFERQMQVFREHPETDVCSAWIEEFYNDTNHVVAVKKLPERHEEIRAYARKRCPVNHPAAMFRKSKVLKAGGYPPIPQYEDYGLWVRMLMNGCRFYNLQESLLYFRTTPDTFRRRGGWKYVVKEIGLQKEMYRIGFISAPTFCLNVLIRLVVRLMPNGIRGFIYKSLLRKKK